MRRLLLTASILAASAPVSADDWLQFGYDAAHSGNNTAESIIGPKNVGTLTLRYSVPIADGASFDGTPVYASGVATPNGPRDIVYALTTAGTLYAIDAEDGRVIWSQAVPGNAWTSASPAIDKNAGFIYSYGLDGYVHKYRLGDGAETTTGGWPQLVTLSASDRVASSLTIGHGNVGDFLYVATSSIGDYGSYHGHLTTIDLASGTQTVFNVMCSNLPMHFVDNGTPGTNDCSDIRGGIWARGGAMFDASINRVYFVSGNGVFDADTGGHNWGDSIIEVSPRGTGYNGRPLDSYTPSNYAQLDHDDRDLGLSTPALIPAPSNYPVRHLAAQVGKEGVLRFIDLENMNGTHAPGAVGGELVAVTNVGGGNFPAQPAIWVDPDDSSSTWMYVGGLAYQITFESGVPDPQFRWYGAGGRCESAIANTVLYTYCDHVLAAYDPRTGAMLWSTTTGYGITHWPGPIVVDGSVYVTDDRGVLWKFGLPLPDEIFGSGFDGG